MHRNMLFVLIAAATSMIVVTSSQPAQSSTHDEIIVVSLGDSYTAGNGAGNYYEPTGCYRSYDSYPWRYVDRLQQEGYNASVWHYACGGNVLQDISGQIDQVPEEIRNSADIILLSVGGNDLEFTSVVKRCLLLSGIDLVFCSARLDRAMADLDSVIVRTQSVLRGFERKFPNATQVVLVGYPNLVSPLCATTYASVVQSLQRSYDTAQNTAIVEMNNNRSIRENLNYTFVSLQDIYAGRGPCAADSDPTRWIRKVGEGLFDEWVHPTSEGHNATANLIFRHGIHRGLASVQVRPVPVPPEPIDNDGGQPPSGPGRLVIHSPLSITHPNGALVGQPVHFQYALRNSGATPVRVDVLSVPIRDPQNNVRDVECDGGTNVTIRPGQVFTCQARRGGLTAPGPYRAWADLRIGSSWHRGQLGGSELTFNLSRDQNGNLVPNPGFEAGNGRWRKIFCPGGCNLESTVNRTVYLGLQNRSRSGRGFLEANTSVRNGSVGQDLGVRPIAGRFYHARVWVKTTRRAPATVTVALWGIGGTDENSATTALVGNSWTPVDVVFHARRSDHRDLRLEFYMGDASVQYNFDDAVVTAHATRPDINAASPFGSLNEVDTSEPGRIRLRGWAIDKSHPTDPVVVHLYVGGQAGTPGVERHVLGAASLQRSDVSASYPWAGAGHGFERVIATARTGSQMVCVHAINRGEGRSTTIDCRRVTIASAAPPDTPLQPTCSAGRDEMNLAISWRLPTSATPVVSTEVQASVAGGAWLRVSVETADVTTIESSSVAQGGYRFRVRAQNGAAWSQWSEASEACSLESRPTEPFDETSLEPVAPSDVSAGFWNYASNTAFSERHADLFRLYWAFFGREPDLSGAQYWVEKLDSCVSLLDITWAFGNSAEFVSRYGQIDRSGYVDLVYANVLGRSPDLEGKEYWVGLLAGGQLVEPEVMLYFSLSTEFRLSHPLPSDGLPSAMCG